MHYVCLLGIGSLVFNLLIFVAFTILCIKYRRQITTLVAMAKAMVPTKCQFDVHSLGAAANCSVGGDVTDSEDESDEDLPPLVESKKGQ